MLSHTPLSARPLSSTIQAVAPGPTDESVCLNTFEAGEDDALGLQDATCAHDSAWPIEDEPEPPPEEEDDPIAASFLSLSDAESADGEDGAGLHLFEAWLTGPAADGESLPPTPPPQPGPLSHGGGGWLAPASRRAKPKPSWPNLPPASTAPPWRLVTVQGDARLRAHRLRAALRAKLKRETNLEDAVIAGIIAAILGTGDKPH